MMSTLEASQDIRSLPSDDMKDIVDGTFPLDGQKDFKDDSQEPSQDPSGDSNLNTPKDPQSPADASDEVKTIHDEIANDENATEETEKDAKVQNEKCDSEKSENNIDLSENVADEPEPVSNGSAPKGDSVDYSCEDSQELECVSDEEEAEMEKRFETEEDTQEDPDCNADDSLMEEDLPEVASNESNKMDEDVPDEPVDPAEAEAAKEDLPEVPENVPESDLAKKESEKMETANHEDITSDDEVEKTVEANDCSPKNSETDDIIDLDDMLKEIGVDNAEGIPESVPEADIDVPEADLAVPEAELDVPEGDLDVPETDSKAEEVSNAVVDANEEKPQEFDDDDDVVMMDFDEGTSENKVPEEKSEQEEPKEAEIKVPEDDESEFVSKMLNECTELLNSIDKKLDAVPSIALDEESSDGAAKKEDEAENEVQDKDDSLKLVIDEDLGEEKQEEEVDQEESKEAEVKISQNDETSNTFEVDPEAQEKSHTDLGNSSDDVLIIDDEPESSDLVENKETGESEVKVSEKSEIQEEKKSEETLKTTEMEIEEEEEVERQEAPKEDEPKKSPSQEPIPIDDDDLSMDDKDELADKVGTIVAKKRLSNSLEYEEKSKRLKLSDDSEKDTDNSQSSVSSKRNADVDSTSRQSENSGDSLKMTLRLRKNEKGKLEAEKISQAEKDVGSLLTPLPKKTSMEFMTRFKKPFQDMSHADLEDLVLQKIAELITHKSEYSEMRKKMEKQEEMIALYRTKLGELSKNFHDLEVVYKRVQQDLDNRNSGYVQIPKITRAVGLQVSVSNHRKQHSTGGDRESAVANNTRTSLAAQEAAKKMKPIQRFTPMRPPMSEAEYRHLDAQEQKQRQEMQQQVQQKLALNAANTSSGTTTITQRNSNIVVLKHTPKPPQAKIISPQPYVVKRTAVRTSTITSTVVTKTVSAAGQMPQRVIMTPSVTQQSSIHKVTVQPQQRSPSVVSPPKKQQVVVDLTDEDDSKAKAKASMQQSLLNGGIPALVAIPSSSNNKPPTTKYVMVQQMAATNGQLSKTMPNKYVPIAPKPSTELPRSLVTPPNIIRRPPLTTTLMASGSGLQRPLKIMPPQRSHPAPLPPLQNQPSQYGMKRIPTRPVIRIKNDEKQGIVISWTMDDLTDDHEEIRDYQIFAYQETSAPPSTDNWRLVGDVKSMMLPMAVTLSQFQEGQRYWFAVRARDIHDRCGMFSVPRTW